MKLLGNLSSFGELKSFKVLKHFNYVSLLFDALKYLHHSQTEFLILKSCISAFKLTHQRKTYSTTSTPISFTQFHVQVQIVQGRIIGHSVIINITASTFSQIRRASWLRKMLTIPIKFRILAELLRKHLQ